MFALVNMKTQKNSRPSRSRSGFTPTLRKVFRRSLRVTSCPSVAPERFAAILSGVVIWCVRGRARQEPVGLCSCQGEHGLPDSFGSRAELATLYVQEPFLGKGVGGLLLKHVELWAAERMRTPLWLKTNSQNGRAIAFYEKHGYSKVGITFFELGNEKHENVVLVGATY